jgi:acetyl-CoA acetyltransferase
MVLGNVVKWDKPKMANLVKSAITGVGMSRVGRKTMLSPIGLFADAALAAITDAGLTRDDIDGVATFPGTGMNAGGFAPVGASDAINILGLKVNWYSGAQEGPAQALALIAAAMAVETGRARHVLVFRSLNESSAQAGGRQGLGAGSERIEGWPSWLVPMGAVSAANWAAMYASRRMHEHGLTREQLGTQAVWQRACAQHEPNAVMHGKPLTMGEYLSARMISEPLCLFDCDVPIDGAVAVIVSRLDEARALPNPPIRIEATGSALDQGFSWDQQPDLTTMAATAAARDLWRKTDITPSDVTVAGLYDGFSVFVPMWLEAFGFCAHGEGGAFIGDKQSQIGGMVAVNTGGGQLSAGRMHGYGLIHEVCLQLRGNASGRQVDGARMGIVGIGGGPIAGAVLLVRD